MNSLLIFLIIFTVSWLSFLLIYFFVLKKKKKTPKNELLEKREEIVSAWKNILENMKKRGDLISDLVDSLENVDIKEKNVLSDLLRMKSEFKYAENFNNCINVNHKIIDILEKSFVILDKYQDILVNNNKYQETKKNIINIDIKINDSIARYNLIVIDYNNIIEDDQHKELAKKLGYTKKDLFIFKE